MGKQELDELARLGQWMKNYLHLIEPKNLDEYVREAAAEDAAVVNNSGVDEQVNFIADRLGPGTTLSILQKIVANK